MTCYLLMSGGWRASHAAAVASRRAAHAARRPSTARSSVPLPHVRDTRPLALRLGRQAAGGAAEGGGGAAEVQLEPEQIARREHASLSGLTQSHQNRLSVIE